MCGTEQEVLCGVLLKFNTARKCVTTQSSRILMSPASGVSEWSHLCRQSEPLTLVFTVFFMRRAVYSKSRGDMRRHVCTLCGVCWSPAGSRHMSLLLGPALPLPGPPWPPAHTPQAADTHRGRETVCFNRSHCILFPFSYIIGIRWAFIYLFVVKNKPY